MLSSARAAARPALRSATCLQTRSYAVLADGYSSVNYKRRGDQPEEAPKAAYTITQHSSGVTLATVDHKGPVSQLALVVNAGSRNDSADAPGVAHFVKSTMIRNIPGDTITRTVRNAELRGDNLYTAHTREQIVIGTEFLRDNLVDAVPTLIDNLLNKHFYPYELFQTTPAVVEETQTVLSDPSVKVVEALHQAAFRSGLGNPLYASSAAAGGVKRAHIQDFASKYFTADRIAIVGHGVSHQDLQPLVEEALAKYQLSKSSVGTPAPSKFRGGELRFEAGPKSESHYAVAFPSVGFTDSNYAASLVLKALLDGAKRTKWGKNSGTTGLLSQAATENTSVAAFETGYSDAGLVGFYIQGPADEVKAVAQKSLAAFKSIADKASADALTRAKKIAIVDAEPSTREASLAALAKDAFSGKKASSQQLIDAINKVSAADVQKLAKAAISAKPAVVAYGNLLKLPYADEL
ncbi:Metalloenzyme, LuxS/M16 peptidase-like protein [Phlyctochytrium arcticum]|nr:Metalloenzyme, LuxS/M16 peptidase-like protein [Phlyctochytrium arcticum]